MLSLRQTTLLLFAVFVAFAMVSFQTMPLHRFVREPGGAIIIRTQQVLTAHERVLKTYNDTYALLESCPANVNLKVCLKDLYNSQTKLSSTKAPPPWWFHSLLRDASSTSSPVHGFWHYHSSNVSGGLRMCTIEKVAIKEWRRVFCELNHSPYVTRSTVCAGQNVSATARKFVIVRDPLERFLSAFVDKCILFSRRDKEGHCEPNPVWQKKTTDFNKGLQENKQRFFEAYVDTVPLKWNFHFMPQALFCDGLYRTIAEYDVVGYMGPNFYEDLHSLGKRYGDEMMDALDVAFKVRSQRNTENTGVETSAATHIGEYYTPRSLRKVLGYMSVDYVALNLPIPEWAERMLQEENPS